MPRDGGVSARPRPRLSARNADLLARQVRTSSGFVEAVATTQGPRVLTPRGVLELERQRRREGRDDGRE